MEEEDYVHTKYLRKCCVSGCTDTNSKRHRFPVREPEVFQAWIEMIKPPGHDNLSMKEINYKYVVCEQHFSQECLVIGTQRGLKRTAIPSINIPGANKRPLLVEVTKTQTVNLSPKATDTRYFSKELMTEFIRVYRQHPSLWKIKSNEYTNKNLKNIGIIKLIEVCKQFHVMEADKEFVLRKIQSIRGSFRKENKKVKDSQRHATSVDDIYVPTLWFFDLLKFTLDQEIARESISNFESASSEFSESSKESQDESNIPPVMEENYSENEEEEVKVRADLSQTLLLRNYINIT